MDGQDILTAAVLASWKQGTNIELIKLLLRSGANPNRRSENGTTALYWATFRDENELVELLIEAGASVEAEQPKDGYTSLHIASEHGSRGIAELLLKSGGESAFAYPEVVFESRGARSNKTLH